MKVVKSVLKTLFGNLIVRKKIKNLDYTLQYKISEHFIFFFMKEIEYEAEIQKSISGFIKAGDIVFDIGANIGQYSLLFSSLVKDKGKVVAFEPKKHCYSFLKKNIQSNDIQNVTALNIGLGDQNTFLDFYLDEETGGRKSSFNKEGELKESETKIELKTLDEIIKNHGAPNFVKIDVEGYEHHVLQGLSSELKNCHFLIEVRAETKNLVRDYFKDKGYSIYLSDFGLEKIEFNTDLPDFCNLLLIKEQA